MLGSKEGRLGLQGDGVDRKITLKSNIKAETYIGLEGIQVMIWAESIVGRSGGDWGLAKEQQEGQCGWRGEI